MPLSGGGSDKEGELADGESGDTGVVAKSSDSWEVDVTVRYETVASAAAASTAIGKVQDSNIASTS